MNQAPTVSHTPAKDKPYPYIKGGLDESSPYTRRIKPLQ